MKASDEIREIKHEIKEEEKAVKQDTKKETKKLLIAILFLIGLFAVFFITKLIFSDRASYSSYTYNGFDFVQMQGLWHTQWQRDNEIFSLHLRYGPKEVEDVPLVGISKDEKFNVTDELYITFDPGLSKKYVALAAAELSLNLIKAFDITPIAACTKNLTQDCHSRPIVTCDNTDQAVLYLKESSPVKLSLGSNCVTIQGEGEDIVRVADRFIWIQYGIMS